MRHVLVVVSLLAAALSWDTSAWAGDSNKSSDKERRILSALEVREALEADLEKISDCYKKFAVDQADATGDLKLELIVRPRGSVVVLRVVAPGTKGDDLEKCVRDLAAQWSLPARKGATHALVPFFFLRTEAEGAGPMESCWSPRGCPKKRHAQRERIRGKGAKGKRPDGKKGKGGAKKGKDSGKKGKKK